MRHVYLLANLRREDLAERLAQAVRRYLDGREDITVHPRVFVRAGRVNVEGIPPGVAKELQVWCADELERFRSSSTLPIMKSMSRGQLVSRTWRLVRLLDSPRGRTLSEITDELGCSSRTVIRDLRGLQDAGLPIYDERDGREKRWKFVEGFKSRVPPPFTVTELLALYFARRLSRALCDTPFYVSLESAHAKIASLLPQESRALIDEYDAVLAARPEPFKDYGRQRKLIEVVTEAARHRKSLDITYHTFSRRAVTERRVDPYRLFYFQGGLYVIGFDHLRGEIRIFALERIQRWTRTDETFTLPEDFDFELHMKSALGIFRGREIEARIRFRPSAAPFVAERQWHETQEILTEHDGSVVLTMRVADTLELRRWILSFGSSADVLDPEQLRREIREEAQAILDQSERSDFVPGQLPLPIAEFLEKPVLSPEPTWAGPEQRSRR